MKRTLFIIIGGVLVLVLIAIWAYVLFFDVTGVPDEQFTDLNLENTTDINYVPPEDSSTVSDNPLVDVGQYERLKQLTTKPIVGFTEVVEDDLPSKVLYVEAGTGHVFSIDLETGEEERISGTTIPSSQVAAFAGNGDYVMVQSGYGANANFTVGEFSTSSDQLRTSTIFANIISFTGTPSGVFLYAQQTNSSVEVKSYNPETLNTATLFTVPFREASFAWGDDVTDAHYVYPKATSQLEGFLYELKNGVLSRLPVDGYGMSAVGNDNYVLFSKQTDDGYTSYLYNKITDQINPNLFVQIPEKCTFHSEAGTISICANTERAYSSQMPEAWYAGEVSFSDVLYEVQNDGNLAIRLINTKTATNQNLDVVAIDLGVQDAFIYFMNKNDNTLWLYERTPRTLLSEEVEN